MQKKTQGSVDVDTSRILVKGPEFLRRQLERESEANKGRVSAVERLAATKPQYVKSQQVVGSSQEPVISFGSASVSSQGSSKGYSFVNTAVSVDVEDDKLPHQEDPNVVRRTSSKKRPDSILLYRQKCELMRGSPVGSRKLMKKVLFSSKDKTNAFSEAQGGKFDSKINDKDRALGATHKDCGKETSQVILPVSNGSAEFYLQPGETEDVTTRTPHHKRVAETREHERKSRRGVARSSSDISSRYSKNFANFDAFFKYCGLDGDVIDSLGEENFCARSDDISLKIRSVSVSTSDDGLSRSSGDSDGLLEEELQQKVRQGSSVVERNARIIKWLYSCRNAAESGKTLRDLD
ncbi:protein FAM110C-like [Myxocyprinus asiaticus]|uniref:protein FAM110C-like n=1 Tax=Myxocyprinus asiaticus TaxID=70543 RepID=UPI002221A7F5|nr:protein FAM110C-like [Myxocyprinus asiaticus]